MGLPTKTPAEARVATARGPPAHVTFAACCLVFFITIIFLHNHNSMAYVHSTIQYSLEAPAGWLQSTSRTTVRAVTIKNAAGEAVTRAALTATTTTTTVATGAAAASSNNKGQTAEPNRLRPQLIIRYVFGHLSQHHTAHAAQVAAAAAKAALPEVNSDIELHPQRVAQVVQQAKAAEQLQQLTKQEAITQPTTTAEKYAGLYGAGGAGSVVFEPNSDLSRCPEGSAAPQGAAAVVLLADSGSGAAVLKRSLDGLMLLYSQASADIRAAFHLFIGLDGDDQDMQQLAHQYALDSLGTLKLVHHRSSSSSSRDLGAAIGPSEAQRNALRADHTRLMLHVFFNCFQYPSVLLLEDDWKLLPDFFEFFEATQWLLTSDPTLYCVSAWNPMSSCHHHPLQQQDHKHHNRCSSHLLRSDVNPGRGWLLRRATGLQLLKAWPQGQQLDWQQHIHSMGARYGQQCIVPDAPRMLPAAVHDTAAGAHIVTAAGDIDAAGSAVDSEAAGGAVRLREHGVLQQPAAGKNTGAGKHQAAAVMTGVADGGEGPGQDGVVDHDAESAPAVAWQPAADGSDTPAALAAAGQQAAVQGQSHGSSWLGRDVSHMLAQPYRRRLHKRLLRAEAVDAVTAAGLTDTKTAACVSYSTAEQLSAAAKAIGVPLTLTAGVRYCYMLPTTPATQHCQDFLPDLAYEGVIATYTPHGVRVFLAHLAYITALHSSTTPAVTPVKRQARAPKAGKPA